MPKQFDRHILKDWPEDRLPVCASPTCGRTIGNGDGYAVLDGTVKLVCLSCALDPFMRTATLTEMTTAAVVQERAAKQRRATQYAHQQRRSTRIKTTARRVIVRPPREPRTERKGSAGLPFKYPPHPCQFCGVVFQPRATRIWRGNQRFPGPQPFCSISCATSSRRTQTVRVCPACDQEFLPKRGARGAPQVCCSRSCARWWFPRGLRNPHPTPLVWSRTWGDGCRKCGRRDRKHRGQGYCPACYRKYRILGQPRGKEPRKPDTRTWAERRTRQWQPAAATATAS